MFQIYHIYIDIYYVHFYVYNFVGVAQTDKKTVDEQTDGKLPYPSILINLNMTIL